MMGMRRVSLINILKRPIGFFCLLLLVVPAFSKDNNNLTDVEASIYLDIQKSKAQLRKVEKKLLEEKSKLTETLREQQIKVLELQEKTSAVIRSQDDSRMSVDQLKQRLALWKNQSSYQKNSLLSYFNDHTVSAYLDADPTQDILIGALTERLNKLDHEVNPNIENASVALRNGRIESASVLNIGPVHWYNSTVVEQSGLLEQRQDGMLEVVYEFEDDKTSIFEHLHQTQKASLAFDPSLGAALKVKEGDGVTGHIAKGGVWAIPIIFFALLALGIAVYKAIQLARLPKISPMLSERVERYVDNGADATSGEIPLLHELKGAQKQLVEITLGTASPEKRDDLFVVFLLENKHRLEKMLGIIAITASVAPLLGLLGTVSGMIKTFNMMTLFGSGDPSIVSGGISEALITTELGLIVAIPALLLNAMLLKVIRSYQGKLEGDAIKLSKIELNGASERNEINGILAG